MIVSKIAVLHIPASIPVKVGDHKYYTKHTQDTQTQTQTLNTLNSHLLHAPNRLVAAAFAASPPTPNLNSSPPSRECVN